MNTEGSVPALALYFIAFLGMMYWAICTALISAWLKDAPGAMPEDLPPVTFLRPLKRDARRLAECVEALILASERNDQIVLGFDPGSPAAAVCRELRALFAERDIALVECAAAVAQNPKISKLAQMTAQARHERLIVSDSEVIFGADFVRAFRGEWSASGADALTAGYRFVGLETWPQQLDAAATLLTLWPGLAWLRRFGRVRLTLGACTALRRADLKAAGGWVAFGDDLAEDHRLGEALVASGRTVRLSAQVVTLVSDALSWRDYWRHQRRVAVTYRVSNPRGFAASILTHALAGSVAFAFVPQPLGISLGILLFAIVWLVRWWITARDAAQLLAFPILRLGRVVLIASLVETACWFLSWFSRRVWWGGRWRRVSWRGKLCD